MIKPLIRQISNDQIPLSQALTKAKLFSGYIQEPGIEEWIIKEIEGYEYNDPLLPAYRRIPCRTLVTFQLPYAGQQTLPIETEKGDNVDDLLNTFVVQFPIFILEQNISDLSGKLGRISLTSNMLQLLDRRYGEEIRNRGGHIQTAYFEIAKIHLIDIINRTKQRLLGHLISIDRKYPNLKIEFMEDEKKIESVHNIITNNITGSQNPITVAVGHTVIQKDINISVSDVDYSTLEKLGVTADQVADLKAIITAHRGDKPTFKAKIAKWLGSVASSLVTQELTHNLPQITEFVQHHLHI
jgi:hypothetical protein